MKVERLVRRGKVKVKYILMAISWGAINTALLAITNDGYTLEVFMYGSGITVGALAMLFVIRNDEKSGA